MIGLYDYDNATYEECIDDLNTVLEALNKNVGIDYFDDDYETLERYGERIKNIAKRLKELEME